MNLATQLSLFGGTSSNAILNLNFAQGSYSYLGSRTSLSSLPGWAFSRTSPKTAQNSAGLVIPFASGIPAITDLGFLVEGTSTNLALHSQDASMWPIVSNVTITGNTGTAPDGTTTATTLNRPAVVGDDRGQQNITVVNDGGTYFVSLFVRKSGSQVAELQLILSGGTGITATLDFNLLTGATGTSNGLNPFVTSYGQWWRVGFGTTNNTTGNTVLAVQFRPNIGGTGSADLWGLQVEKASFASSYIPTTSATVTRAADAPSITGLTAAPGTLFVQGIASTTVPTTNQYLAALSDGSANNRLSMFRPAGTNLSSRDVAGGVNASPPDISGAIPGGSFKAALAFSSSRAISAAGGSLSAASAPSAIPAYTTLSIGVSENTASAWLNGLVQRVLIYPNPLPDAQLQALTQ